MDRKPPELATLCVHRREELVAEPGERPASLVVPLDRSSTYRLDEEAYALRAAGRPDRSRVYARETNPTVEAVEARIADLEGADRTLLFASGMAALHGILMATLEHGDNLVAVRQLYGGSFGLYRKLLERLGVELRTVDLGTPQAWRDAIDERTRIFACESLSNPLTRVIDLPAAARVLEEATGARGLVVGARESLHRDLAQRGRSLAGHCEERVESVRRGQLEPEVRAAHDVPCLRLIGFRDEHAVQLHERFRDQARVDQPARVHGAPGGIVALHRAFEASRLLQELLRGRGAVDALRGKQHPAAALLELPPTVDGARAKAEHAAVRQVQHVLGRAGSARQVELLLSHQGGGEEQEGQRAGAKAGKREGSHGAVTSNRRGEGPGCPKNDPGTGSRVSTVQRSRPRSGPPAFRASAVPTGRPVRSSASGSGAAPAPPRSRAGKRR